MHSHQRPRAKILFEVLCAMSLAASFAGAWDQTGSSALLASASIMALFSIYWTFGLFGRRRVEDAAQPTAAVADVQEAEVEPAMQPEVFAYEPDVPTEPVAQQEVFAREPDVPIEPEPVAAPPKKRPARKSRKAAAEVAPVVEPAEPVVIEQPVSTGPPLEQLFDVQPRVREARPAFGRKTRGPRSLPAV